MRSLEAARTSWTRSSSQQIEPGIYSNGANVAPGRLLSDGGNIDLQVSPYYICSSGERAYLRQTPIASSFNY
jgi:hypothetical protein